MATTSPAKLADDLAAALAVRLKMQRRRLNAWEEPIPSDWQFEKAGKSPDWKVWGEATDRATDAIEDLYRAGFRVPKELVRFLYEVTDEYASGVRTMPPARHAEIRDALLKQLDARDRAVKKQLQQLRVRIDEAAAPPAGRQEVALQVNADTIVGLGDRRYKIGTHLPVTVTMSEDYVLCALAKYGTLDSNGLDGKSGVTEARKVLGALKRKYGRIFKDAIHMPGGRGKGGYCAAVLAAPPE